MLSTAQADSSLTLRITHLLCGFPVPHKLCVEKVGEPRTCRFFVPQNSTSPLWFLITFEISVLKKLGDATAHADSPIPFKFVRWFFVSHCAASLLCARCGFTSLSDETQRNTKSKKQWPMFFAIPPQALNFISVQSVKSVSQSLVFKKIKRSREGTSSPS